MNSLPSTIATMTLSSNFRQRKPDNLKKTHENNHIRINSDKHLYHHHASEQNYDKTTIEIAY